MDATQRDGCFLTTLIIWGETITTTTTTASNGGAEIKIITEITSATNKTTISIQTVQTGCRAQLEIVGLHGVMSMTPMQTAERLLINKSQFKLFRVQRLHVSYFFSNSVRIISSLW